jgi:hypothetical protein
MYFSTASCSFFSFNTGFEPGTVTNLHLFLPFKNFGRVGDYYAVVRLSARCLCGILWRTADLSVHVKLELEDKVTDETQQDEKSEEDQNVHPENLQKNIGLSTVRTVPAHFFPCFFRGLHFYL